MKFSKCVHSSSHKSTVEDFQNNPHTSDIEMRKHTHVSKGWQTVVREHRLRSQIFLFEQSRTVFPLFSKYGPVRIWVRHKARGEYGPGIIGRGMVNGFPC